VYVRSNQASSRGTSPPAKEKRRPRSTTVSPTLARQNRGSKTGQTSAQVSNAEAPSARGWRAPMALA
jgi:hypothetical protein